ncbi:NBR1-Ig-like domain-containing protein [Pseudomonas japonica]|uniref:NBR1-Ig-like domain-containing protein n=1 Tax=Pseudomonas japonica TaxID=256466 RepID=UPI003830211C
MVVRSKETLKMLLARRSRELGKSMSAIAQEAGMSRTYMYTLARGDSQAPSVRTLVRLAKALQVSPLLLFRSYADLSGAPQSSSKLAPTNRAVGLDDLDDIAVFNADVTMPDQAIVIPGESFQKIWEIQNVGRKPWRGRRLVRVDGEYAIVRRDHGANDWTPVMNAHLSSLYREIAIPDTLPGQPVRLAVEFAAPCESCSVASIWRIEDEHGRPCYRPEFVLHVIVTVMAP